MATHVHCLFSMQEAPLLSGAEFFANASAQHYLMWWVRVTVAVMGYRLMVIPNRNHYHAPSVNSFKNRLDKQWSNEEILYDYKASSVIRLNHECIQYTAETEKKQPHQQDANSLHRLEHKI